MFYREAGDFKTTYAEDSQTFPIKFDRWRYWLVLAVAYLVIPFFINDYWANAIFVPFLIYAIAAIGLNILTGYCGQVSLGTGGFMAVGAYACYKLMTSFPDVNIIFLVIMSGGITALVGAAFGLPSLRIKGFYLAVATLAAQFFLVWLFNKVAWFYNYSASGQINAPERFVGPIAVTGPNTEAWARSRLGSSTHCDSATTGFRPCPGWLNETDESSATTSALGVMSTRWPASVSARSVSLLICSELGSGRR